MSTLAFYPWLQLRDPHVVDGVHLIPYQRGKSPYESKTQESIDTILARYFNRPDTQLSKATLAIFDNNAPTAPLSEDQISKLFSITQIITTAGLAQRQFFTHPLTYCNSQLFKLIVQNFTSENNAIAITTRRRDGSTQNLITGITYRVVQAEHIHSPLAVEIDFPLVDGLLKARQHNDYPSINEAILGFNLANTDSEDIAERVEIVLLCGAFERLFGCKNGKSDDLAKAFCAAFVLSTPLDPKTSPRTDNLESGIKSVREIWILDFFRRRNDYAHGRVTTPAQPARWELREHLILGSFVFSLALKIVLSRINAYSLSASDKDAIDIFEALVAIPKLFEPTGHTALPGSWPWTETMKKANEKANDRAFEAAAKNGGYFE